MITKNTTISVILIILISLIIIIPCYLIIKRYQLDSVIIKNLTNNVQVIPVELITDDIEIIEGKVITDNPSVPELPI